MRTVALLFLVSFFSWSSAQINEDFSDDDFTQNPTWSGHNTKFTVDNKRLRSNSGTSNDLFYLSTPNNLAIDCQWDFLVDLQFNTSSANYVDFVLVSDTANPALTKEGYFLRVGNTKDELALYKISNGSPTLLADGPDGKTENKTIRIKVTRSLAGEWAVAADYAGGTSYTNEISVTDADFTTSTHFAIAVKQSTASFFNKHFFDDIKIGPIERDTIAPAVTRFETTSKNHVTIGFSEAIKHPQSTNFSIDKGIGAPTSVDSVDVKTYNLSFASEFNTETYQMSISGIRDLLDNQFDTVIQFQYTVFSEPEYGDLLINEIFADPTPIVGLPDEEFVEIYNNSNKYLQLEGCTFSDGGTPSVLPKFTLNPSQYVVICKNNQATYENASGQQITISNFPALNNAGDALVLRNGNGQVIDSVTYTDNWYKDGIKAQGGYSIERIDFATDCSPESNWTASTAGIGGTPGKQNAVYGQNPDKTPPQIEQFNISDNTITLQLSEALVADLANDLSNFELVSTQENPNSISVSNGEKTLKLIFDNTFEQNRAYTLKVRELADCVGNSSSDTELAIFYFTTEISEGDIIINELLFNPLADGVDFIELYNNSDKFINLENLKLGRQANDTTKEYKTIGQFFVLQPQQYVAISTDSLKVKNNYPKAVNQLQISSLPSMNNDAGIVLLATDQEVKLDSVPYSEKQHFELLSSVDGVSLERLSFARNGYDAQNWHSAAASVGFATPGYQNSQFIDLTQPNATFQLQSKIVSPDADGYEDELILNYELDNVGYTLNAYIFNLAGNLVHQPVNNETLSTTGFITWNGVNSNGEKVPVDNYILLVEAFNMDGKVIKKKLAFSVIGVF